MIPQEYTAIWHFVCKTQNTCNMLSHLPSDLGTQHPVPWKLVRVLQQTSCIITGQDKFLSDLLEPDAFCLCLLMLQLLFILTPDAFNCSLLGVHICLQSLHTHGEGVDGGRSQIFTRSARFTTAPQSNPETAVAFH